MSLKAKMEAVIYAAEEPVTLPQLVGLLGQEAQAELLAAEVLQGELALDAAEAVVVLVNPAERQAGDPAAELSDAGEVPDAGKVPDAAEVWDAADGNTPNLQVLEGAIGPPVIEETLPGPAAGAATGKSPAMVSRGNRSEPPISPALAEQDGTGTVPESTSAAAVADAATVAGDPAVADGVDQPTPAQLRAGERRLREYMRDVLDVLVAEYRDSDRGLEIREIAGGYRFATKSEYHDAVRGFVRSLKPPLKLSLQALETLAVVAYKQPVTAPEVGEIRGVDSAGVLGSLMTRKLVTTAGRKQVIGRPILYKTTKEFLLRFGLKDLAELPSIEEFERLATNLNEAVQEEIPMVETPVVPVPEAARSTPLSPAEVERDVDPNRNVHLPQADGDSAEVDEEHLTPAPDGPGEFTGNENAPPADNVAADGRISGVPPTYDPTPDELTDSPANDALVQREQGEQ